METRCVNLRPQPVRLASDTNDGEGQLVFVDDRECARLRLDAHFPVIEKG